MKKIKLHNVVTEEGEYIEWALVLTEEERHLFVAMLGREHLDTLEKEMISKFGKPTADAVMRVHERLYRTLAL